MQSGLFLVAHEMLISAIKDRLHDFFADTWTAEAGWKTSAEYWEEVSTLDPKGKNDPVRGSIVWLRRMGAIDDHDEKTLRELTEERNRLAHELRNVVDGSHQHDFTNLFPKLVALVEKIDRWWVVNVEIETDQDLSGTEVNEEEVVLGSLMLLQLLAEVALGEDDKTWALYKHFMKEQGG